MPTSKYKSLQELWEFGGYVRAEERRLGKLHLRATKTRIRDMARRKGSKRFLRALWNSLS